MCDNNEISAFSYTVVKNCQVSRITLFLKINKKANYIQKYMLYTFYKPQNSAKLKVDYLIGTTYKIWLNNSWRRARTIFPRM